MYSSRLKEEKILAKRTKEEKRKKKSRIFSFCSFTL